MKFSVILWFEPIVQSLEDLVHLQTLIQTVKLFSMLSLPLLELYCKANVNSVQVHVYSVLHV